MFIPPFITINYNFKEKSAVYNNLLFILFLHAIRTKAF